METPQITTPAGRSRSVIAGVIAFLLWFIQWFPDWLHQSGVLALEIPDGWKKALQLVAGLCGVAAIYLGRKASEETGKLAAAEIAKVKETAEAAHTKADVAVTSAETAAEIDGRVKRAAERGLI